jgi:hypothetical protein
VHRRRLAAVVIAILAAVSSIIGLVLTNVPLVVVSICMIGAAACMWTYRRHGQKINIDQPVDQDADPSAA